MFNLFNRRSRTKELAQQLTLTERRALALPGTTPTSISYPAYAQMERDSMIQTALTIKKLAVMAPSFTIKPSDPSDAAKARQEFILVNFAHMTGSPQSILVNAMDAFSKGWSIQELVFEFRQGQIWLAAVRPKDPGNFGLEFDAFGSLKGLNLSIPGEAEKSLPKEKFILYRNRYAYNRPKGLSDLDAAYPHWQAKQSLLKAWKVHLERYASPTVMAKYRRGTAMAEQQGVLSALERMAESSAVVFPEEFDVTTLGGNREQIGGYLDSLEFHNREMARAILGQTLTTDEGRRVGSLALGKVHLQVLLLQVEAIRRELADVVMNEQVIRPLIEMNFGPGHYPVFEFGSSPIEAFVSGKLT